MVVDVECQREPGLKEGGRQQIEMREEPFAVIDAGAGQDAAVIVDEFEERILAGRAGEPAVRSGVVLPELADVLSLPLRRLCSLRSALKGRRDRVTRCQRRTGWRGFLAGPGGVSFSRRAKRRTVARSRAKSWRRAASEAAKL